MNKKKTKEVLEMLLKRKVSAMDSVIAYVNKYQPYHYAEPLSQEELLDVLTLLEMEKSRLERELEQVRKNIRSDHFNRAQSIHHKPIQSKALF